MKFVSVAVFVVCRYISLRRFSSCRLWFFRFLRVIADVVVELQFFRLGSVFCRVIGRLSLAATGLGLSEVRLELDEHGCHVVAPGAVAHRVRCKAVLEKLKEKWVAFYNSCFVTWTEVLILVPLIFTGILSSNNANFKQTHSFYTTMKKYLKIYF